MSGYNLKKNVVISCLKIFFTFTNSVDPDETQHSNSVGPDEMQHYAAIYPGLHCLQKCSFRYFPNISVILS